MGILVKLLSSFKEQKSVYLITKFVALLYIIFLLICGLLGAYLFSKSLNNNQPTKLTQEVNSLSNQINPPAEKLSSGTVSPTIAPEGIPKDNVFYYGILKGEPGIFFRDEGKKWDSRYTNNPFLGVFIAQQGVYFGTNFEEISNKVLLPYLIIDTTGEFSIHNSYLSKDKKYIYISFSIREVTGKLVNKIVEFETNGSSLNIVWSNGIGDSEKYSGPLFLLHVERNKYLIMNVWGCVDCGEGITSAIVYNLQSGKEKKYIADNGIGDVHLNISTNTITYKKYVEYFSKPCDGREGICYPDMKLGETLFEDTLP